MSDAALALLERKPLVEKLEFVEHMGPPTLGSVLHGLGKEPFTDGSVEQYKRYKARKANAWLWLRKCMPFTYFLTLLGGAFGAVFGFMAGAGIVVHLVRLLFHWETSPVIGAYSILLVVSLVVLLLFIGLNILLRRRGIVLDTGKGMIARGRAAWTVVHEASYTGKIPAEVYADMCEIRANLPGVQFFIHVLAFRDIIFDPFVEAHYGQEHAFTNVWDEDYQAP